MDSASQFFQNLIEYTQQRPLSQPYEVAVDSPNQNRLQQTLPSFSGSYTPTFVNHPLPQQPNRGIELPRLQPQSTLNSRRAHPPSAVSSASSLTENTGNSNRTINGSNVFYIQFAEASTPVSHTEIFSQSAQTPAPSNSQEPLFMTPTPPSTSSPQTGAASSYIDDRTPGQRYASLLLACKLGYPLWKPSPRRTDTGKEHIINIGDVGVPYDLDPFHTLFNITTYSGGLAVGNTRIPEGVDPPCDIRGDVTIDTNYHEDGKLLARPQGSIARQTDGYWDLPRARRSRGFGFRLFQKEGALLMLPRGSTLRKLQKTHEFKTRLLRHWRDWYDFADAEGDLDETQTLCLVTGVQQCRAWAMAVWDEMSDNDPGGNSESLTLTVDEVGDGCSWDRCPPRCSTQSLSSNSDTETHETVFIRAFWISRRDGSFSTRGYPPPAGRDEDSSGDGDFGRHSRHRSNPFGRFQETRYASQNPFNPFRGGSPSNTPSPPHNDSGQSSPSADRSPSAVFTSDRGQIDESSIIRLKPEDTSNMVGHPCQVINALAFKLVSRALPFLLDTEFAAFSHDDDWISAVESFDGVFPEGIELLKHICKKFKFVVEPEGGVVYTEILTSEEMGLVRNGAHSETTLLPVLFQLREPEIYRNELLEVELNEEIKQIRLFESDSLSVEVTVEVGSSDTNNPARSPLWSASDYSTYSLFELRQQLAELKQEFEQPGLTRPLLTWKEESDEKCVIEPLAVSCIFSTGEPFY
ncbi:hypothetical protein PQX77_012357 [Marasmius sp. AFHP31]|nr:hypothetical protein PQX77_012357 [Marasmius sp. AFHP31]